MPSIARISRAFLLENKMDKQALVYKLIDELQALLGKGWVVETISAERLQSEGRNVVVYQIELAE